MSVNTFWDIEVTHPDGRVTKASAHASGMGSHPAHVEEWIKNRHFKGKDVTVKATKTDVLKHAHGHPFLAAAAASASNTLLVNAAGKQVDPVTHEVLPEPILEGAREPGIPMKAHYENPASAGYRPNAGEPGLKLPAGDAPGVGTAGSAAAAASDVESRRAAIHRDPDATPAPTASTPAAAEVTPEAKAK